MSGLDGLRKADRSRLVRRAIRPEDNIGTGSPEEPRLWIELLPALFGGLFLAAVCIGVYALAGHLTGRWETGAGGIAVIVIGCLFLAGGAVIRRRKRLAPQRMLRARDLASGEIDEIVFEVVAAKSFRDPEHGVVSHFLRLSDGRVFFDVASGEVAEEGWRASDALPARDQPRRRLHLLFGIVSGDLLASRLSGEAIVPEGVFVLRGSPDYWPSPGTFRKLAWDRIEASFAARDRAPA